MKLGLALSGGGFRASLFHLGVLACLADLSLLKSVRYLSTVSGGSIVGAAYYLKVKQLLEGTRKDGLKPSDQAYQQIVRELIDLFLTGVQKNIRMRTFLNPLKNVRMLLRDDYSRSDRIGELYTKYFYKPTWESMGKTLGDGGIPLQELKIFPQGVAPKDVKDVEAYNNSAPFKIPVLIINATTLNSGHNWQFTAKYVGEPARRRLATTPPEPVDTTTYFDRRNFDQSPPYSNPKINKKLTELYLGDAVAASACVPVLFQPMAIHDLYGEDVVIELVDGGVFDNQGLQALYDKGATEILCSDASLQLEDEAVPSTRASNVLLRSNDVVMDALREEELGTFVRGTPGYSLTNAHLLHWNQLLTGPFKDSEIVLPPGEVLKLLARVRTDLDSFHDTEAYSLMYTGYALSYARMGLPAPQGKADRWKFWDIQPQLSDPQLLQILRVSSHHILKVFSLKDVVAWAIALLVGGPLLVTLGYVIVPNWDAVTTQYFEWLLAPFKTVGTISTALIVVVLYLVTTQVKHLRKHLRKWLKTMRWLRVVRNIVSHNVVAWLPASVVALASLAVWIHLKVFDCRYLAVGTVGPNGLLSPGTPSVNKSVSPQPMH
jgi:NTE family protein